MWKSFTCASSKHRTSEMNVLLVKTSRPIIVACICDQRHNEEEYVVKARVQVSNDRMKSRAEEKGSECQANETANSGTARCR